MRMEHVAMMPTAKVEKPEAVWVEYLFEIIDAYGHTVQTGTVRAGDKHLGAAWAALALTNRRAQTMWVVRVARVGAEKSGSYLVERTGEHKFELTRIKK